MVAGATALASGVGGRRRPVALGLDVVVSRYGWTIGAVDRSTEEARNSSTILRLSRTRSESVWTTIPSSALREHAGTSVRAFSSSTMHTRQAFAGVSVSP